MQFFLITLGALMACVSAEHQICIDPTVGHRSCMTTENFEVMGKAMKDCNQECNFEDDQEDRSGDDEGVSTPFHLLNFIRGYSCVRICVFETLGWLCEDGNIVPENVHSFMGNTRVGESFDSIEGQYVMNQCAEEAEDMCINKFFAGMEPNNLEECDKEECEYCDKHNNDNEGPAKPAKAPKKSKASKASKGSDRRFGLMSIIRGVREDIADAVEEIKDNDTVNKVKEFFNENSEESSEEEEEEIVKKSCGCSESGRFHGKHAHIHIPKQTTNVEEEDEEVDVDVVEEFMKLNAEEQEECYTLLRPLTYFRCVKNFFDYSCAHFINDHLMEAASMIQVGATPKKSE